MTAKHNKKRVGKVRVAIMGILMTFSGLLGVGVGTAIEQPPPRDQAATILVVNNYHGASDKEDVTAELAGILRRAMKRIITVDVAVAEIAAIVPLDKVGPAVKEKVRGVVIGVIGMANDEGIKEGVQGIADAMSESSKPLPTPLPTPSSYVKPAR